jgi:hypothetical protein
MISMAVSLLRTKLIFPVSYLLSFGFEYPFRCVGLLMMGKWLFDAGAGLTCMADSEREEADQVNFEPKGSKRCIRRSSNPRW